jgi:hypothetical protein
MKPVYLHLAVTEQRDILQQAAIKLGKRALILEKDIWVCWALQALFSLPASYPMAFGGGTSLSKVYDAIGRFSEDIDIALDYRALRPDIEKRVTLPHATTDSQIKSDKQKLRQQVRTYACDVIIPHLERALRELPDADHHIYFDRPVSGSPGQKITIVVRYRSVMPSAFGFSPDASNVDNPFADPVQDYLKSRILIELVGYNVTEPHGQYRVSPDMASLVPTLSFPTSRVVALSAERTFWQKVTLIHEKCRRQKIEPRLARHWYDVAMLAQHATGQSALENRHLLADVVAIKPGAPAEEIALGRFFSR